MLFLAAAVVAARFDEAGEEAVQAEESIRDQRVEDERKDGISYKCGDAEREEDKGDHCGCKQQQSRDQQPFSGGADTVVQTFILAQQTGRGDRQKEQRGDAEQEPEQDTQEKQGGKAENEDRKDDTKHKADDDRDRVITFRVFYSQHTLADFEKKCPILRVNALVRKKWLPSPFWLLPTVRNARELSERTNRTAIKHNNRKSP